MSKIQNTDNTKCWWGCGATETSLIANGNAKWYSHFGRQFLAKLNTLLPYNPATVLLSMYSKELKTYVYTKTCTWMLIAALFIIAKTWMQPRCSLVGEWINELWYIQTMEHYSALRRNELLSHEKTQSNLKCILLSERSPSEETIHWMIPTIWLFWKRKNYG